MDFLNHQNMHQPQEFLPEEFLPEEFLPEEFFHQDLFLEDLLLHYLIDFEAGMHAPHPELHRHFIIILIHIHSPGHFHPMMVDEAIERALMIIAHLHGMDIHPAIHDAQLDSRMLPSGPRL